MVRVRISILGSGGPQPGSDDLPSVAVQVNNNLVLLDAGEGVQRRLAECGYSVTKVRYVLITHLHGDHVFGLLPLIQSRSLGGSTEELQVIGPKGIRQYVETSRGGLYFTPQYPLEVIEVGPGEELSLGFLDVYVLGLDHAIPTNGYVLKVKKSGVKISYLSDTRVVYELRDYIEGSHVLIHDSTFSSDLEDKAREYGHSTASQAARLASMSRVGMLLLYHISPRYKKRRDSLLTEARRIFPNSFIAEKYLKVVFLR